ncbi:PREDICTED: glutaredoxin-1 [Crocodylus porosus]|uniref:Glutaredoxin-1 n=1 Tax=Crocodylus porosus TaxID=8502 RepID=A0A7M4E7T7_CROPO|nr:PREDICTED: glutaredoxin-1 [Crocodylus porosus]XP_019387946.1 PREDICTED: glutaredoxin-1 [Crocodylus porosus]
MSQQFVKSKLGANKVAVFIKPTCPYCQGAVELLKKYAFKPGHLEFIDLTARNDMSSIQDYFLQSTGARTVPRVYIGEVCIGGFSDLDALDKNGELVPKLKQLGALQ